MNNNVHLILAHFLSIETDEPGRYGFNGREVNLEEYKDKRLPNEYRRRWGMASPILYTYK